MRDQSAQQLAVVFQAMGDQMQHLALTLYLPFDDQQAGLQQNRAAAARLTCEPATTQPS